MGKSKKHDDELRKLKKLKKLLGEDKLRQELEKVTGKKERKKSKKKSRHSSDEVWEEKKVEETFKTEKQLKINQDELKINQDQLKINQDQLKINQDEDKREDKLQWMYKGADDLVDTEDYLLGKKVDQAIVRKQRGETAEKSQDSSNTVGSIFDNSAGTQAVDMANKLREDPLFVIKQQELNKKKDLLNNPVRMKQLQQLLKKSKQSKKKKRKEKRKQYESSSEDSSNSDDVKPQKRQGYGLMSSKQSQGRSMDSRYEGRDERSRKPNNYYNDRNREGRRDRSPMRRPRSRSPDRSRNSHMSRSRSPRNRSSGTTKKMDAKEMERRRAEMMDNAKSRDEDRRNRVERYRDEDRAEKESERNKSRKAEFIEPMKLAASSVEDRIKRNIFNIQRTSVALDKNFAKR